VSPTEGVAPAAGKSIAPPADDEALSIVPLIFNAIWSAIVGFFRRLFGRV
jgi:hypothetical protein